MSERNDEKAKPVGARRLEPMAGRTRGGQPTCYHLRPVVEPAPKQPSQLLYLPPIWTRASFWLPLGRFAAPPQPGETPSTDPHDDCAA